MRNKTISSKVLLTLLIIFIIITILSVIGLTKTATAYASNALSNNIDETNFTYSDTDNIYGTNLTIRDYSENLYNTKTYLTLDDYNWPIDFTKPFIIQPKMTVGGDDDIIRIIPRNYFTNRGKYLYIGKEYGYYINTVAENYENIYYNPDKLSGESKNNDVQVFVFDITTNLHADADLVTVRIEPLFQYRYKYITANENCFTYGISVKNSSSQNKMVQKYEPINSDGLIFPMPVFDLQEGLVYNQTTNLYLKDIEFISVFFNEQEINSHNTDYIPKQDNGTFITWYNFEYDATMVNKNIITPDLNEPIKDIVSYSLSAISLVPVIGKIVNFIGLGFSFSDFLTAIKTVKNRGSYEEITYDKVTNRNIEITHLYNTRDGQLANYIDEKDNSTLIKNILCSIKGDDADKNLWYGVGNYAEEQIRISNSSDGEEDWYTRFVNIIGLSVIDSDNPDGETISYGAMHTHMLGNPIYKQVDVDEEFQLSILPDGNNYFTFTPQYTSDYQLYFAGSDKARVFVEDNTAGEREIVKSNGKLSCLLEGGREYRFRISSDKGLTSKGTFTPTYVNNGFEIKNDYLVKFDCARTDMYELTTEADVLIEAIYSENWSPLPYGASKNLNAYLDGGKSYYIICNTVDGNTKTSNVHVGVLDKSLSLGANPQISLPMSADNYTYFKFTAPTFENNNYDCIFSFDKPADGRLYFNVLDEQGLSYNLIDEDYTNGSFTLPYIQSGKTYYIGLRSTAATALTPTVTQSAVKYEWIISHNGESMYQPVGNSVTLPRGLQYTVSLKIRSTVVSNDYLLVGATKDAKMTDSKNGLLTIYGSYPVNGVFYIVGSYYDGLQSFHSTLEIHVTENPYKVNLDRYVDYENRMVVSWQTDSSRIACYILNVYYTTRDNTTSKMEVLTMETSFNCLPYLYQYGAVYAQIDMVSIMIMSNNKRITIDLADNLSVELNCLYSETKTINDSIAQGISNYLQLQNINCNSEPKYLTNDIKIYGSWNPVEDFNSTLYGQEHQIQNLSINITSKGDYGLFVNNHGTILNLRLTSCSIVTTGDMPTYYTTKIGTFAANNYGTISKCYAETAIDGKQGATYVGGIAAYNYSHASIENCTVYGTLGATGDLGGIAAFNNNTIKNCSVNCTFNFTALSIYSEFGGLVGYSTGGNIAYHTIEGTVYYIEHIKNTDKHVGGMGYVVGAAYNTNITASPMASINLSKNNIDKIANNIVCFNNKNDNGNYGYSYD